MANRADAVLSDSTVRFALYTKDELKNRYKYDNPLFAVPEAIIERKAAQEDSGSSKSMRLKDFLASVSSFSNLSDQQLVILEQKAEIQKFQANAVIFKQGEDGDNFYIIHDGAADVLIQTDTSLLMQNDLGKSVNRLTSGCYFGERALMNAEPRAASIRTCEDTVCLVFSRAVYEDVISGSNALIGKDASDHVDLSKDYETRSLLRHVESILAIDDVQNKYTKQIKDLRYNLATALTPELDAEEIISRMVITIQRVANADRVGLFVLNEDRSSMVLKVSERAKGITMPVRGIAGAVITKNVVINISDAYEDERFDSTMDKRTQYRTRQILGVPLKHPDTGCLSA